MSRVNKTRWFKYVAIFLIIWFSAIVKEKIYKYRQKRAASIKITNYNINIIYKALHIFEFDVGRFPTEREGIESLISAKISGPYIESRKCLYDGWGGEILYFLENGKPLLVSAGRDLVFGTKDDIKKGWSPRKVVRDESP